MAITDRLLAQGAIQGKENRVIAIDSSAVVTRLLLFPTYILKSVRLDEMPFLAKLFGESGLARLFETGALKILFESYTIGQLGQARADLNLAGNRKRLPLESFSFSPIRLAEQEKFTERKLDELTSPLAEAARRSLVTMPIEFSKTVFDGFYFDLRKSTPVIEKSIACELRRLGIPPKGLRLQITETESEDFGVDSNLKSDYGLPAENAHRIVERALLAVADLNMRFAEMMTYEALSGIRDQDKALLEGRLKAIADLVDSSDDEHRFNRITEIAGLHTLAPDSTEVDVEKLIKVRESDECRAFRDWLRSTDMRSDVELKKRLKGLNSKIRETLNSRPGKIIRFAISSGLSALLTPLAALGVGAVDAFLVERVAPKDAIVSFLSESYPSLFRNRKHH
jgi:hypothetical protein